MVQQEAKNLAMKFGVRIQLDMFDDIFTRRKEGEKISINKAMENHFMKNPSGVTEKHIAKMILEYRENQLGVLKAEIEKQRDRFKQAVATLKKKPTKKSEEDKRISAKKIEQIESKLEKIATDKIISDSEATVYPGTYLTMLAGNEKGELFVAPFRYHLRPFGQPESFDRKYNGCYNARKDNLTNPFWKPVFGKRHGIILVTKFFEHVAAEDYVKKFKLLKEKQDKANLILSFVPEGSEYMVIPTLWDINKQKGKPDLYSCALITDVPPDEIAATGHNRCPIFLKQENVMEWLRPAGKTIEGLYAILADKETPNYKHQLIAAS